LKSRYHRTHKTITSSPNQRFANNGLRALRSRRDIPLHCPRRRCNRTRFSGRSRQIPLCTEFPVRTCPCNRGSQYENLKDVRVISVKRIRNFLELYPKAESSLLGWYTTVKHANWENMAEMNQVFPNADLVGRRTVFNIMGGNFRLIARVNYARKTVFILHILTHKEYDRGRWKE
jgi:mRNA interferase HigB